jgi:hypothetical protein
MTAPLPAAGLHSGGGANMDRIDALLRTSAPFGPWSPNAAVDHIERGKQFRSLAMGAAVFFGANHPLVRELRCAETDNDAAARALAMLDTTPTLTRRRLLSVFGSVTWPRRVP